MEREAEDIASVVDSIGDSVNLLGLSYGALLALEAALLTRNVCKLVLYDPGIEVAGQKIYPHEVIDWLEALLDKDDRAGIVVTTMREVAGLSSEVVEYMRERWQPSRSKMRQAGSPTLVIGRRINPYEYRCHSGEAISLPSSQAKRLGWNLVHAARQGKQYGRHRCIECREYE